MVEVNVAGAATVDEALETGGLSPQHKIGVLITRIGIGSYIVRAHPAVPYGLVRQQQA